MNSSTAIPNQNFHWPQFWLIQSRDGFQHLIWICSLEDSCVCANPDACICTQTLKSHNYQWCPVPTFPAIVGGF